MRGGERAAEADDKGRAEARRAADVELADARNEAMRRLDEERSRLEAQMNRNAVEAKEKLRRVESSVVDAKGLKNAFRISIPPQVTSPTTSRVTTPPAVARAIRRIMLVVTK